MSMYPSLEDMEVDKLQRAQAASQQATVVQQHSSVRLLVTVKGYKLLKNNAYHRELLLPRMLLLQPLAADCIPHSMTTWALTWCLTNK